MIVAFSKNHIKILFLSLITCITIKFLEYSNIINSLTKYILMQIYLYPFIISIIHSVFILHRKKNTVKLRFFILSLAYVIIFTNTTWPLVLTFKIHPFFFHQINIMYFMAMAHMFLVFMIILIPLIYSTVNLIKSKISIRFLKINLFYLIFAIALVSTTSIVIEYHPSYINNYFLIFLYVMIFFIIYAANFTIITMIYCVQINVKNIIFAVLLFINGTFLQYYSLNNDLILYFGASLWFFGYIIFAISVYNIAHSTESYNKIFNFKNNIQHNIIFNVQILLILLMGMLAGIFTYFNWLSYSQALFIPSFTTILSTSFYFLLKKIFNSLQIEFNRLINNIRLLEKNNILHSSQSFNLEELNLLQHFIQKSFLKIVRANQEKMILEKNIFQNQVKIIEENNKYRELLMKKRSLEMITKKDAAFRERISLLVHDIRSPTTLTNHIIINVKEKKSINDIEINSLSIANNKVNLLTQQLLNEYKTSDSLNNDCYFNIYLSLYRVSQELITMHNFANINLEVSENTYSNILYGNIDEFERMIANIIGNAVEDLKSQDDSYIVIKLYQESDTTVISIKDNGSGIPDDIKNKFLAGIAHSSNKKDGNGLGLVQVRKTLDRIGCEYNIIAEKEFGTAFIIRIPPTKLPNWFCDTLNIQEYQKIIIFDDDKNIYQLWQNIFAPYVDLLKLEFFYFDTLALLNEFIKTGIDNNILFLCDYDTKDINGLEVIQQTNLANSILVTSFAENEDLQAKIAKTSFKMLDKQLIPYIKISTIISNYENVDMIWLDDQDFFPRYIVDTYYHDINVKIFSSVQEFIEKISNYSKNTIIILDNHIEVDNVIKTSGVTIANKLNEMGYKNIIIVTGETIKSNYPEHINVVNKSDLDTLKNLKTLVPCPIFECVPNQTKA